MERDFRNRTFFPWPQGGFLWTQFSFLNARWVYTIWIIVSYYLVTADNFIYNLRHASYQFKTRTNVFKFSYFFRAAKSWNSLPLNVRKTESLNDFKYRLKSFLRLKDISTFSKFIFLTSLIIFLV